MDHIRPSFGAKPGYDRLPVDSSDKVDAPAPFRVKAIKFNALEPLGSNKSPEEPYRHASSSGSSRMGFTTMLNAPKITLKNALKLENETYIGSFQDLLLGRTCNLGNVAKFASHWNAKGKQGLKAHLVRPGTVAGTEAAKQALNGKFENAEQKKGIGGYLKADLEKEFAWVDEMDKCASRLKGVRQRIATPLDAESRDDIGNPHVAVIRLVEGGGLAANIRRTLTNIFRKDQLNLHKKSASVVPASGDMLGASHPMTAQANVVVSMAMPSVKSPEQASPRQILKGAPRHPDALAAIARYNQRYPDKKVTSITMPVGTKTSGCPPTAIAQ